MTKTMFGRWPDGAGCACACATCTGAPAPIAAAAAASVVPPSRTLRRSRASLLVWTLSGVGFMITPFTDDTAKADMACRGVDRLGMPRSGPIAAAIIWRAQVRTALEHLARNPDVWLAGIVAHALRSTARVYRNAAGLRRVGF